MAAASQQSLPGDALYPIKRGIEHFEVAVAWSDHARGSEYLDQASTRLDEISDLTVAHGDDPTTPSLVRDTLEAFSDRRRRRRDALHAAYDGPRRRATFASCARSPTTRPADSTH